ncbi:DegT/DnrJ/EryC1/StrS family aminotransferase [Sphingomonas kaistensis]|uniref:DegT/DnrJ/EryC1/StrS family aminotransferase n=1 Tax=Sphingomonas kaistensis TaxID=298708 RepID=A0ABZ2G472_9SPHN
MLNLARVIATGRLMHHAGETRSFTGRAQARLAQMMGVEQALLVNSGTSALIVALKAAGIGPGDEVLVPAYTWVSTASAPLFLGAIPILVDIDESLTMDPADLERKITPFSKAIIPVHMLNLVCDMDSIMAIATRHGLAVIEDACQAVGVTYKGRRAGSIGHLGAFSFNHYKNVTSGEGGAVITNDGHLMRRAEVYHDIGTFSADYSVQDWDFVGCNQRVSELTSAVLLAQFGRLDKDLQNRRRRRARNIDRLLPLSGAKVSPHHDPDAAVGLTLTFENSQDAKEFAAQHSAVTRIGDIKRHDYVSWLPVLQHCGADPRTNPLLSAQRKVTYSADMCARTIDILSRTCLVA